jgi:hypothetical protein
VARVDRATVEQERQHEHEHNVFRCVHARVVTREVRGEGWRMCSSCVRFASGKLLLTSNDVVSYSLDGTEASRNPGRTNMSIMMAAQDVLAGSTKQHCISLCLALGWTRRASLTDD